VNTYHVIAIHLVHWRVGRIYRKHSFLCCSVFGRVYRAVAWQRVDRLRHIASSLKVFVPSSLMVYHGSFFLRFVLVISQLPSRCSFYPRGLHPPSATIAPSLWPARLERFPYRVPVLHSREWSPNWVHSARRPFISLLYLSRVMVRMENLGE
jgi:hypothetical protein